ncbi:MAG TPA: phosphotransferase [Methylophaga sp.]|nr:phosphotransferase [Methylophaga sp.]
MVAYPALSPYQQRNLPDLLKPAMPVAAQFDDSSHQLWFCQTSAGPVVLKVADKPVVRCSAFWQGVNRLFALNFPASLADTMGIQQFLSQHSPLEIPECLSANSGFVVCRQLAGKTLATEMVNPDIIRQLASHIAALHQQTADHWGALQKPKFTKDLWTSRLRQTLSYLAANNDIAVSPVLLGNALKQAADIQPNSFVPVMLDLRWDQFLTADAKLTALVDLDAFVLAPRELELVLLELLLNASQAAIFAEEYQRFHSLPDLSMVRTAYRTLLFLMNVFGESDCEGWLAKPAHFQP